MEWVSSMLRKIVFTACAGLITKIVASGAVSEAQLTTWIELSLAILIGVVVACWTKFIKPWILTKMGK